MYQIDFDEDKSLIRLKLAGFWDADIATRFSAEFLAKAAEVGRNGRIVSVLGDGRELPVQSAEVSEVFGKLMDDMSRAVGGRVAIITATTLNRLQAQRIFHGQKFQVFDEPVAAEAWALEGIPSRS
ncbi:hypothetical protein [Allosphingosinicella vermicomposti]|uniref:hypothetical protein n=1 Tax=Allosphingosinicella vermicomposti TaxID=614671 RepID=UPI000D10DD97|nr:hypothetical protein [Allosphingosinicella vermicomposti]